ncbi:MAG: DUF357 domain-containing protein [Candidatus Aenigmatarchaeota archaeon]|nr:MAG: DUF357 domain-containing protein [Candidatus Aenigmarchaeota archaeon]
MMTEEHLRKETEKWLKKIRDKLSVVGANDEKGKGILKNINAYVEDCEYFMKKGDLIRAFEAVIWAWAYLEIYSGEGILKSKSV